MSRLVRDMDNLGLQQGRPSVRLRQQRQPASFEAKVAEVNALLPRMVGERHDIENFHRGIGFIAHNPLDVAKYIAGVTQLLVERGNLKELAAFVANPFQSGLDYTYADCHKKEDKLMSAIFARLSCFEVSTSRNGNTQIREWAGPWCVNPAPLSPSTCVEMPIENLSNCPDTLPITFEQKSPESFRGNKMERYGTTPQCRAVGLWDRTQGAEFLAEIKRNPGAEVFISLSSIPLNGTTINVPQGKLSFTDARGVMQVFEFNGGEFTARKIEKYIREAGGHPVYGHQQIVHKDATTHIWYGTLGVDPTRNEIDSWLKFVHTQGSEKCKITLIEESGRSESPLLIAESDGQMRCISLLSNSLVTKALGNLALYSYEVSKYKEVGQITIPRSEDPTTLFPSRDSDELFPKVRSRKKIE